MKKSSKRVITFLMVLLFCIVGFSSVSADAKTKKGKTFSVKVPVGAMVKGDSKKLSISPKNIKIKSYKSSNKNVIKVTSKGKITALKSGTSTITVTSKAGIKVKVKVKVFSPKSDMIVNRKIKGKKALWHIKAGKVVKKAGFATDGTDWYYTKAGVVNKKTGLISGKVNGVKALWYVKKGKVCLDFTGAYKNWFVKNGKVNKKFSGNTYSDGYTYKIKNGKVIQSAKGKLDAFFGDEVVLSSYDEKVIGAAGISIKTGYIYPKTGYTDVKFNVNGKESALALCKDDDKYEVLYNDYMKDYNIECVRFSKDKWTIKVTTKKAPIKKPMSISGKASDHYVTKDYEYIESENFIIFMNKGVKFDGNVLVKYEKYKKATEKFTGLSDKHKRVSYHQFVSTQKEIFGANVFDGVDPEMKKIHIFINDSVHPHCGASRDTYCYIALDSYALDVNENYGVNTEIIHEYAHYLHLTNALGFNVITNEGYATYIEKSVARALIPKNQLSDEQFFENFIHSDVIPTGRITKANAESTFVEGFPDGVEHTLSYNYGYVLMVYIHETYGKDAFKKLFKEGQVMLDEQLKSSIWSDLTGENTAALYKKVYSKTFFDDFMKWLEKHPEYEVDIQYSMD